MDGESSTIVIKPTSADSYNVLIEREPAVWFLQKAEARELFLSVKDYSTEGDDIWSPRNQDNNLYYEMQRVLTTELGHDPEVWRRYIADLAVREGHDLADGSGVGFLLKVMGEASKIFHAREMSGFSPMQYTVGELEINGILPRYIYPGLDIASNSPSDIDLQRLRNLKIGLIFDPLGGTIKERHLYTLPWIYAFASERLLEKWGFPGSYVSGGELYIYSKSARSVIDGPYPVSEARAYCALTVEFAYTHLGQTETHPRKSIRDYNQGSIVAVLDFAHSNPADADEEDEVRWVMLGSAMNSGAKQELEFVTMGKGSRYGAEAKH